ncbi:hypothetical protein RFI_03960 [Reticulomyxa filosa]|uniref:Uncharacterized protein n=1 Tax=Reticulomyxa filosa TaxID=46433 RepID=X6P4K8_RETFI|nr:hypothetical protein RFI_03960 [Reticulomyxa filosa]|eukprot:ETO33146.1 hypothetical protein RFI_03960 [Reticulomyxa filosa]
MYILKKFGNKLDKITISKVWRNCNQIYADTFEKLREICTNSNLNELNMYNMLEEKNEIKILREMCLHILWNILRYLKHIKYRIYGYGKDLQYLGFKKGDDDNNYYQNSDIQFLLLYKKRYNIPDKVCMLSNGKWKDYKILFDYRHRTIILFDEKKIKNKIITTWKSKQSIS